MVQYMISTNKYYEVFKHQLADTKKYTFELTNKWTVNSKGEIYSFCFEVEKSDKILMLETLATIISNIVQSQMLIKIAKEYLKERTDLTIKEKREIENMFILNNYVAKEEGVSYISYYLLYTPILKALEEQKILNIDGWLLFRTHQYKTILEDILEQTVFDYQTQKDYIKFVNLLRESRKLQESLESTLHLISDKNHKMKVFNSNKEESTKEYIKKYCTDLIKDTEVTYEDIIMNIFITVCPEKVIIHNKKEYNNLQFIETLEMIFEGQMEYCEGCSLCTEIENGSSE